MRAHATTPVPQEMTLFISRCAHAPAPCPSTLARRQPLAAAALSQTRGFRKCFLNGGARGRKAHIGEGMEWPEHPEAMGVLKHTA